MLNNANIDNFKFWCPIEKSQDAVVDPNTGEQVMRLGGIASTADEDADGEFLDPRGFDIKPLLTSGMVNWHHQAKGQPTAIIGEPVKAEILPEGLYIETDLYPSSQIARDVWELANTLEKDSKTRRLGYSIEGKVIQRKSENKNSPDYKKIVKAIITGVAITHQPKNPKTFANIIKGEIGDDAEDETDVDKKNNEGLNTKSGKPLLKESLNGKTYGKIEVMERLFRDIPGISVARSERIYSFISKISSMRGKKRITDEDILKAYEALGIASENDEEVDKGCGKDDKKRTLIKSKNKDDDEEYDDTTDDDEEYDDTTDDDEEYDDTTDDDEDTTKKSRVKKGGLNHLNRIEKAVGASHRVTSKYIKALGVMIKDASQKLEKAADREQELLDLVKAQEDTIFKLAERIEDYGSGVPAPKSLSAARPIERQFSKASDDELSQRHKTNQVSMSRQPKWVTEILDQATFAKGYDAEFSKACTTFEATKTLPAGIIARIKNECGYEIVK